MRLATSPLCREVPCTSYSTDARGRYSDARRLPCRPTRSRTVRGATLCAQSDPEIRLQDQWDSLELITRKLTVAVSDENYSLAAQLRKEKETLAQNLPAVSQYTFHHIQALQAGIDTGSLPQQLQAVKSLGGTGDKFALPYLFSCLKNSQLSPVAFEAIYSIFIWHPNPEITALMTQACSLLNNKDAAIPILDKIIEREPDYYEAWNKRATAFYLAKDFESSIKDCQKTLELQPDHFLAMSGMGLCYAGLERWDDAVHWFQQSVGVHPHMEQIQKYINQLKAKGFGRDSSAT